VLEGKSTTRLGDFIKDYLEYSQNYKLPNSYRADQLALRKLVDHFGPNKLLIQIGVKEATKFLAALQKTGIKTTSLAIYYRHLKAAFSQAVAWKQLRENPFKEIKEPKGQESPPRYLQPGEIERILTAETDPAFHRLWRFYLWSGVRRREALSLTWAGIDRKHELIMITQTKNRKHKVVRITRELAGILDEMPGEVGKLWPWTPDAVSHHFNKTAKRAGVKARLHDLRHTYASYLLMSGVQLKIVKELLGHRDIKATQIYAHLDRAHLDEALEKLSFKDD
jgi:site-specific recombinase XerD